MVSNGKVALRVTGSGSLNLDPYVEREVYVYGSLRYHGELRTYYMTAEEVSPAR
jgi:hypothetical protein